MFLPQSSGTSAHRAFLGRLWPIKRFEGRKLIFRCVVVVGWLVAATAAYAAPRALSGPAIKHLVSGAVMHINTPLSTIIPVHYGEDGSLAANAGAMGFYLGATQDTGRWWVSRTRICHKWKVWFDGKAQCLKLHKLGNKIFWESQKGETGTAHIKRTKPRKPDVQVVAATPQAQVKVVQNVPAARAPTVQKKVVKAAKAKAITTKAKTKMASLGSGLSRKADTPKQVRKIKKTAPKKKQVQSKRAVKLKPMTKPSAGKKKIATEPKVNAGLRQTSWQMKPSFRVARVAELDVLNIRQGPSEYTPIVGGISHQARGVKIVGTCQSWWCPVSHGRVKGWVNRFYLTAER